MWARKHVSAAQTDGHAFGDCFASPSPLTGKDEDEGGLNRP